MMTNCHKCLALIGAQEAMANTLSSAQFAEHVNQGGASRSFKTGEVPESPGVMVSIPGPERISSTPYTVKKADEFKKLHAHTVDSNAYQGGWKVGNKVYEDVSMKQPTLDSARKAGEEGKQISGYDLGKTDIRRPEGGLIYFGRNVPGIESNSDFRSGPATTSESERMEPKPRAQEFADQAHISRDATRMNRSGNVVPVSVNEVYAKIAKNRRNRGV